MAEQAACAICGEPGCTAPSVFLFVWMYGQTAPSHGVVLPWVPRRGR